MSHPQSIQVIGKEHHDGQEQQENCAKHCLECDSLRQKLESYESREKDLLEENMKLQMEVVSLKDEISLLIEAREQHLPQLPAINNTSSPTALSSSGLKPNHHHHLITSTSSEDEGLADLEVRTSTSTSSSSVHDFEEEDNRSSHSSSEESSSSSSSTTTEALPPSSTTSSAESTSSSGPSSHNPCNNAKCCLHSTLSHSTSDCGLSCSFTFSDASSQTDLPLLSHFASQTIQPVEEMQDFPRKEVGIVLPLHSVDGCGRNANDNASEKAEVVVILEEEKERENREQKKRDVDELFDASSSQFLPVYSTFHDFHDFPSLLPPPSSSTSTSVGLKGAFFDENEEKGILSPPLLPSATKGEEKGVVQEKTLESRRSTTSIIDEENDGRVKKEKEKPNLPPATTPTTTTPPTDEVKAAKDEEAVDRVRMENESLKRQVESLQSRREELEEQVLELEEAENDARSLSQKLQSQVSSLMNQMESLQSILMEEREQLAKKDLLVKQYEDKIREYLSSIMTASSTSCSRSKSGIRGALSTCKGDEEVDIKLNKQPQKQKLQNSNGRTSRLQNNSLVISESSSSSFSLSCTSSSSDEEESLSSSPESINCTSEMMSPDEVPNCTQQASSPAGPQQMQKQQEESRNLVEGIIQEDPQSSDKTVSSSVERTSAGSSATIMSPLASWQTTTTHRIQSSSSPSKSDDDSFSSLSSSTPLPSSSIKTRRERPTVSTSTNASSSSLSYTTSCIWNKIHKIEKKIRIKIRSNLQGNHSYSFSPSTVSSFSSSPSIASFHQKSDCYLPIPPLTPTLSSYSSPSSYSPYTDTPSSSIECDPLLTQQSAGGTKNVKHSDAEGIQATGGRGMKHQEEHEEMEMEKGGRRNNDRVDEEQKRQLSSPEGKEPSPLVPPRRYRKNTRNHLSSSSTSSTIQPKQLLLHSHHQQPVPSTSVISPAPPGLCPVTPDGRLSVRDSLSDADDLQVFLPENKMRKENIGSSFEVSTFRESLKKKSQGNHAISSANNRSLLHKNYHMSSNNKTHQSNFSPPSSPPPPPPSSPHPSLPLCETIKPHRVDINNGTSYESTREVSSSSSSHLAGNISLISGGNKTLVTQTSSVGTQTSLLHPLTSISHMSSASKTAATDITLKLSELEKNEKLLKDKLSNLEWINKEFVKELELREQLLLTRESEVKELMSLRLSFSRDLEVIHAERRKMFDKMKYLLSSKKEEEVVEDEKDEGECKERQEGPRKDEEESMSMSWYFRNGLEDQMEMKRKKLKLQEQDERARLLNELHDQEESLIKKLKEGEEQVNFVRSSFDLKRKKLESTHASVVVALASRMKDMEEASSLTVKQLEGQRSQLTQDLEGCLQFFVSREEDMRQRINQLEKEAENLSQNTESLQQEINALTTDLNQSREREAAFKETIQKADQIVSDIEKGYKQRIALLEDSEKLLRQRIKSLEEDLEEASLKLESHPSHNQRQLLLEGTSGDEDHNPVTLRETITRLEESEFALKNKIKLLENERKELLIELQDNEQVLSKNVHLQREYELLKREIFHLKEHKQDLDDLLKSSTEVFVQKEAELKDIIDGLKKDRDSLAESLKQLCHEKMSKSSSSQDCCNKLTNHSHDEGVSSTFL